MARIAVDANPATRQLVTGTEVYTRELCARLREAGPDLDFAFYGSRPASSLGFDLTVIPFSRLWSQARLPVALTAARPDLLFVPAHSIPLAWPGRVLTVVHDLAFERHPGAYSVRERTLLQATTRWAVARCGLLIAVSEATKQDLVSLYGASADRVRVVHNGGGEGPHVTPAPASRLRELGVESDFVLQVGRIEPRKNQAAALAAVERMEGVTLVVAGSVRDVELAAALRASPRCRVVGAVDQPALELLYGQARAVVVPSRYEGFGFPVLEGMARGKAVVAARNSSLPEIGGDGALYVEDTSDAEAFAAVLREAITDSAEHKALLRRAKAQAARFTWERCAEGVVEVIRELVSRDQ